MCILLFFRKNNLIRGISFCLLEECWALADFRGSNQDRFSTKLRALPFVDQYKSYVLDASEFPRAMLTATEAW
jgi:hypothetical protein